LGDSPAWYKVKAFIERGTQEFMHGWVWNPKWDELEEDSAAACLVINPQVLCGL
jgi:hypothetical protein